MAHTSHGRCNCAPNRDHPSRYSSQLFPLPSSLWFTKRHSQTFKIINLIFISFFALCLSFASLTLRPFRITVMRHRCDDIGMGRTESMFTSYVIARTEHLQRSFVAVKLTSFINGWSGFLEMSLPRQLAPPLVSHFYSRFDSVVKRQLFPEVKLCCRSRYVN